MAELQYKKRLQAVEALLKNTPALLQNIAVAAGRIMYAEFVSRIFQRGVAADGSSIGKYSTKPAYFSPNQRGKGGVVKPRIALPRTRVAKGGRVPSLTPIGKSGQTVFKNGKPHKTAYIAIGYSGFRKAFGRQNQQVDLNLTGSLFLSIQLALTKKGIVLYFATQGEAAKGRGAEKRFGKAIFDVTAQEKAVFDNEIRRILRLLIADIMSGKTKV